MSNFNDLMAENTLSKPKFDYCAWTWVIVACGAAAIFPFVMALIEFLNQVSEPALFVTSIGLEAKESSLQDMFTYAMMLLTGVSMLAMLTAIIASGVMFAMYHAQIPFMLFRYGAGGSIGVQALKIMMAVAVWVSQALSLYNGERKEDGKPVVATPEKIGEITGNIFGNDAMIWGVWVSMPLMLGILIAGEMELRRRDISPK